MISLSFFDVLNQKARKQEKPVLSHQYILPAVQFGLNYSSSYQQNLCWHVSMRVSAEKIDTQIINTWVAMTTAEFLYVYNICIIPVSIENERAPYDNVIQGMKW